MRFALGELQQMRKCWLFDISMHLRADATQFVFGENLFGENLFGEKVRDLGTSYLLLPHYHALPNRR